MAVDLFAGAGGFSLGLARAGYEVVLANELSTDAEWTYRHNLLPDGLPASIKDLPPVECGSRGRIGRDVARRALLDDRQVAKECYSHFVAGPIQEALTDVWLNRWHGRLGREIDLLVAGPPCQGFSAAGRKRRDDERNMLAHEVLRVVGACSPRIVVIENVPGMLHRADRFVAELGQLLASPASGHGYVVQVAVLQAATYGVPQARSRMVLVGVREDLVRRSSLDALGQCLFPVSCPDEDSETASTLPAGNTLVTRDVLGDLPSPSRGSSANGWRYRHDRLNSLTRELRASRCAYLAGTCARDASTANTILFNHEATRHSRKAIERMRMIRELVKVSPEATRYQGSKTWVRDQLAQFAPRLFTGKHTQRPLDWKEWPNITVTSLPDDFIHPGDDRIPTVRELARLQTFPDWFEFKGTRTTGGPRRREGIHVPQYTQVANAVPPRMAYAVAAKLDQVLAALDEDRPIQEASTEVYASRAATTTQRKLDKLNKLFLEVARTRGRGSKRGS